MVTPAAALEISLKRDRYEDSSGEAGDEEFDPTEPNFAKRFCKEFWGLSELLHDTHDVSLGVENFEEDLISNVMKSLEEEINSRSDCSLGTTEDRTCDVAAAEDSSGPSVSDSASSVSGKKDEGGPKLDSGVDIGYLLEATDDELGIPPSPHAQFQFVGSDIFDASSITSGDLLENVPSETQAVQDLPHLCRLANFWYDESQELFGQDFFTRNSNGELSVDHYLDASTRTFTTIQRALIICLIRKHKLQWIQSRERGVLRRVRLLLQQLFYVYTLMLQTEAVFECERTPIKQDPCVSIYNRGGGPSAENLTGKLVVGMLCDLALVQLNTCEFHGPEISAVSWMCTEPVWCAEAPFKVTDSTARPPNFLKCCKKRCSVIFHQWGL